MTDKTAAESGFSTATGLAERSDKKASGPLPRGRAGHEMADRVHRRIERHFAEARLPPGKILAVWTSAPCP